MKPLVVMIDGLGKPPDAWYAQIGAPLIESGIEVWSFDRRDAALKPDVYAADNAGDRRIILVPYSFGAEIAAELSSLKSVSAVAMIDGVHEENHRKPFDFKSRWAVAFTRKFWIGRAIGLVEKPGHKNVQVDAGWFGHSRIIERVAPDIVEFVRKAVAG